MDAYQPETGDRDRWVPGAEMVSAEFSKGPCLKIVRWKGIEKGTPNELLASTLVNTHGCALHIQKKIFFLNRSELSSNFQTKTGAILYTNP